jgi:hypothetical protein
MLLREVPHALQGRGASPRERIDLRKKLLKAARHDDDNHSTRRWAAVVKGVRDVSGEHGHRPGGCREAPVATLDVQLALKHVEELIFMPVAMQRGTALGGVTSSTMA